MTPEIDVSDVLDEWLTREELASRIDVHPNNIYRLEDEGRLPRRSTTLGPPRWSWRQTVAKMRAGQLNPTKRGGRIDLYRTSGTKRAPENQATV